MTSQQRKMFTGYMLIFMYLAMCVQCHPGKNMLQEDVFGQITKEGRIGKKEIANNMLKHMMDVVRTLYSDLGASDQELQEVDRKRSAIMACYFQAVSCY